MEEDAIGDPPDDPTGRRIDPLDAQVHSSDMEAAGEYREERCRRRSAPADLELVARGGPPQRAEVEQRRLAEGGERPAIPAGRQAEVDRVPPEPRDDAACLGIPEPPARVATDDGSELRHAGNRTDRSLEPDEARLERLEPRRREPDQSDSTIIAVTMPNIPSGLSACVSTWQWNAQTPSSVASTMTSTRSPGATSTVSS